MRSPFGPHRDPRLDELFIRYWDNALSDAEAEELERRLASDSTDREWFRLLSLQAVAASELPAVARAEASVTSSGAGAASPAGRWSRRRVLQYLGMGVAATVVAGAVGHRLRNASLAAIRLTAARGTVTVLNAAGAVVRSDGPIPLNGTVSTHGFNSWAVLTYRDGSSISLAGDSVLSLRNNGRRLLLGQGNATADVRIQPPDAVPLVLGTAVASLNGLSGAVTTLGHTGRGATEVGVFQGLVTVAAPSGEPLDIVREGEVLTVRADGDHRKQAMPATPDDFAWDLTRPLPEGWHIGSREVASDGPVVRPRFWFDPYHQAEMSQIRSDKQWTRGFFRLLSESVIRVRYWIERPGPSQLCICVRTPKSRSSPSGVLECNDAFANARPRHWQWLEARAGDMLDNMHAPEFGPPWIGFLVILNTFETDLGLNVAEFRVTRPGVAAVAP